jgi:hypothetical protein
MGTPKPRSVKTEPNPDCPIGTITTVTFDHKEFEAWATQNPTASFYVPFEDGSPSPWAISAELYLKNHSDKWAE